MIQCKMTRLGSTCLTALLFLVANSPTKLGKGSGLGCRDGRVQHEISKGQELWMGSCVSQPICGPPCDGQSQNKLLPGGWRVPTAVGECPTAVGE